MDDVIFKTAWRRDDPQLVGDAITFWEDHQLVPRAEQHRRSQELVAIAYCGGRAVGVATAVLFLQPQLRARVAWYRCSVSPEHRRQALSYRLSGYARGVLEAWSWDNPSEKVAGMAAVVQAREYGAKQLEPTWPEYGLDLNLACYLPNGEQLRVAWFAHGRVLG